MATIFNYADYLDTINAYYAQSDIWAKYMQSAAGQMSAAEYAEFMQSVPNVTPKLSASGKVIGYEYIDNVATTNAATNAAQAINSNVSTAAGAGSGSAAASGAKIVKIKTPVNSTTAGGLVTSMKSGLATAGNFVFTEVVPAVMAASCGICLGKIVDSALYNANPDFWDSRGMSSLNPETWNDITMGDESLGARIFNGIFGLNPTTNEGQLYCDEMILAYLAAFMANKGVFDSGDRHWVLPDDQQSTLFYPNNYSNCVFYDTPFTFDTASGSDVYRYTISTTSGGPAKVFIVPSSSTDQCQVMTVSDAEFQVQVERLNISTGSVSRNTYSSYNVTKKGITYCMQTNGFLIVQPSHLITPLQIITPVDGIVSHMEYWDLAYILYNGTIEGGGGVDGIPDQRGAVIFDPSGLDLTDIDAVLQALKSQYPDLFNGAMQYEYIDANGNPQVTLYVPVGYPNYDPAQATQPEAITATQADTAIDPAIDPAILAGIAAIIGDVVGIEVGPTGEIIYTPTPDDEKDPNKDDTGEGDTPTVIIPSGSVSALFAVYNPTQAQVNAFGSWLWSSNFVDQLKKIFNDPMESIISLHKVFGTPSRGGSQDIYVGYLDSGVSSQTVSNQYTTVDCGKVTLLEYFGNVFDYTDTDIQLYLPFIGFVPLNVADVMRAQLGVKYHIDVLTGECLADVEVIRDLSGGVIYQYSGNCAVHYPVSSGSYMGIVGSLLGVGAGVAATVASGGVAAPMMLTAGASLLNAHTDVARSGNVTANAGAMGIKKPYLVISRPQTALPTNYAYLDGVGSNQTVALSSCSGFIKVSKIHLQNVSAFDDELSEIESLLSEGVIIQ